MNGPAGKDQEAADARKVDGAVDAIRRGAHGEAQGLLMEVIHNAPEDYRLVEETEGGVSIKFWDMEQFLHYVNFTRKDSQDPAQIEWMGSAYPRAYFHLGFLMIGAGNHERALHYLERGQALEPSNPAFAIEKAIALSRLGRFEEALESHRGIEAVGPFVSEHQLATSLRGRGFVLVELGDLDAAEAAFRESLTLEPENPIALHELGYIDHLRAGGPPSTGSVLTENPPMGDHTK